MAHLSSVHQGCELPVHLAGCYVPQEVHPLVAEVHLLVRRYIYAIDAWVGGEEACWAMAARTIPSLRMGNPWIIIKNNSKVGSTHIVQSMQPSIPF